MLYYAAQIRNQGEKTNIVKSKGNEDPVTLADLKVNELIMQRINEKYPNFEWGILSEENVKLKVNDQFILDKDKTIGSRRRAYLGHNEIYKSIKIF